MAKSNHSGTEDQQTRLLFVHVHVYVLSLFHVINLPCDLRRLPLQGLRRVFVGPWAAAGTR